MLKGFLCVFIICLHNYSSCYLDKCIQTTLHCFSNMNHLISTCIYCNTVHNLTISWMMLYTDINEMSMFDVPGKSTDVKVRHSAKVVRVQNSHA